MNRPLKPGGCPAMGIGYSTITMTSTERHFDGPFKELLNELAILIDWLKENTTSHTLRLAMTRSTRLAAIALLSSLMNRCGTA
jgi:hypothetical protein